MGYLYSLHYAALCSNPAGFEVSVFLTYSRILLSRFKRACASPTRRCRSELANKLNGDVPVHVIRQTFDASGPPNGPYLSCSTFDPIHIFYSSAIAVCALRMCKRGLPLAMTTGISWVSIFFPWTHGKGSKELVLKGTDEGDALSVGT